MGDIINHVLKQRQQKHAAEMKVAAARRIQEERAEAQAIRDRERAQERDRIEAQRRADRETYEAQRRAEREAAERRRQKEKALADATTSERARLGAPVTHVEHDKSPRAITVWHYRVPLPPVKLKDQPKGVGPVAYLPPGGGAIAAKTQLLKVRPALKDNAEFRTWARGLRPVLDEVKERYPILLKLRDTQCWERFTKKSEVALSETVDEQWRGKYGSGTRKVTTVYVPVITAVMIRPDGLRIRIAYRDGDSAKRWFTKLDLLIAAFKSAGVDASDLKITEAKNGDIILAFHDSNPFSDIPSVVTPYDAARGRSLLGITSKGQPAYVTWNGSSGMVVGGVPGSGKTASLLPVFAGMVGKCELHVFDGKSGFDLDPLKHIARTYNRSGDIDAPLETLREIEELRVTRAEALHRKLGVNNFWNMTPQQRELLGVTPVFVVLDEVQTWLDTSGMDTTEKATANEIRKLVRTLVQKGRSAGIVVVLTTQKPDATSIPTVIRDNAALKLCFRVSTPEQATTVLGGQSKEAPDPTRIPMPAKGRAVMETEGRGVSLLQAAYVGPDDLDKLLRDSEPVPDQAAVAAELVGKPKPAPEPVAELDEVDDSEDSEDSEVDTTTEVDEPQPEPEHKKQKKTKKPTETPKPRNRGIEVGSDDIW